MRDIMFWRLYRSFIGACSAREVEKGDHIWFIGEVQATHVNEGYEWRQGLLFKSVGKEGFFFEVGVQRGKY